MSKRFFTPIDLTNTVASVGTITVAPTRAMQWDYGDGTLSVGLNGGNVKLSVGQQQVVKVYNGTGSAMSDGQVVYVTGAQGQRPSVALAIATTDDTSSKVLGVVAEPIANGSEGFVTTMGIVKNINTASFAAGTALWLSPTTAGAFTGTKTVAPNHLVFIGYSLKSHATAGQIFVNPQNGYELEELHNVLITSPTASQTLIYNQSSSIWINSTVNSIASATISASSVISSSAAISNHANTASSINSSLITGTTLPAAIVNSSLTSVGTLTNLTVTNPISGNISGNAGTASSIHSSLIKGTTLPSTIVNSSLTSVGTLTNLTVTNTISGNISGNAGTASAIHSSLITGTTLPAAIVSSSLTGLGILSNLTVSGSISVDSGTLHVDPTNNRVGVNTTAPASALHVVGGAYITGSAKIDGALSIGTNNISPLSTKVDTDSAFRVSNFGSTVMLDGTNVAGTAYQPLFIGGTTIAINPGGTTRLFVDSNGNVGIRNGTSNAASALHVVGGAYITGSVLVDGTITGTSTTQAAGNSSTSLATTAFVSNVIKYSGSVQVDTASVAGVCGFNISSPTALNGVIITSAATGDSTRVFLAKPNLALNNGTASNGHVRVYVENNAGTPLILGTAVRMFYMAW